MATVTPPTPANHDMPPPSLQVVDGSFLIVLPPQATASVAHYLPAASGDAPGPLNFSTPIPIVTQADLNASIAAITSVFNNALAAANTKIADLTSQLQAATQQLQSQINLNQASTNTALDGINTQLASINANKVQGGKGGAKRCIVTL